MKSTRDDPCLGAPAAPLPPLPGACWFAWFHRAPEPLLLSDADGQVLACNPVAASLLGTRRPTEAPWHLSQLLTDTAASKVLATLRSGQVEPVWLPGLSFLCDGRIGLLADLILMPLHTRLALVLIQDTARRWHAELRGPASPRHRLSPPSLSPAWLDSLELALFAVDPEGKLLFTTATARPWLSHFGWSATAQPGSPVTLTLPASTPSGGPLTLPALLQELRLHPAPREVVFHDAHHGSIHLRLAPTCGIDSPPGLVCWIQEIPPLRAGDGRSHPANVQAAPALGALPNLA